MKKLALIGTASVLLIATAAYAADGHKKWDSDGNGAVSKQEALTMAGAHFEKLDVDGNGVLNADDRKAKQKEYFAKMDGNGDGVISEDEFMARHAMHDGAKHDGETSDRSHKRDRMGRHMGGHSGRGFAMLAKADQDGDHAVTRAEFDAAVEEHFAKADKDGNGEISADERQAAHKAMGRKHRSHDGN